MTAAQINDGLRELREAEIIAEARQRFERDLALGKEFAEDQGDAPLTWETCCWRTRMTYVRIVTRGAGHPVPARLEVA